MASSHLSYLKCEVGLTLKVSCSSLYDPFSAKGEGQPWNRAKSSKLSGRLSRVLEDALVVVLLPLALSLINELVLLMNELA